MRPFVFIADLHFHAFKSHSRMEDGINSRLSDTARAFREVVNHAVSIGSRYLIIAGDVFHVRGKIRPTTFNLVHTLFTEAAQKGLQIHIIPGNHDLEDLNGKASSVDTFKSIDGVEVHTEVSCWDLDGKRIAFVPYTNGINDLKEIVLDIEKRYSPDYVVMHCGIDELKPSPLIPESGMNIEWLLKNTKATYVAGHYHRQKCVDRFYSIGALTQHNFGDSGDRGCLILNDEGMNFMSIKSPKFYTIDLTKKAIDLGAEPNIDELHSIVNCNFIRIVCDSIEVGEEARKKAINKGAISVQVELSKPPVRNTERKELKIASPQEMISQYIDIESEKYGERKAEILNLYDNICSGGA